MAKERKKGVEERHVVFNVGGITIDADLAVERIKPPGCKGRVYKVTGASERWWRGLVGNIEANDSRLLGAITKWLSNVVTNELFDHDFGPSGLNIYKVYLKEEIQEWSVFIFAASPKDSKRTIRIGEPWAKIMNIVLVSRDEVEKAIGRKLAL